MWRFKKNIYKTMLIGDIGLVTINNVDTSGTVNNVKVNGVNINISSGVFPVSSGQSITGSYSGAVSGLSTVEVFFSVAMGAPINLSLTTGYTACIVDPGYALFTGVNLLTNPDMTIVLQPQGALCT